VSAVSASPAASGSVLDPVRTLQHALYRAAKADPGRRFHALRDKVFRRDVLWRAWVAVRRNDGAPGIDKTTLDQVEQYGVARLLDELASELRDGSYRPLPARRVFIPKPGTTELRPLSIPAVRDRIVQAVVKIVLEPVFEALFLPCSFGFRPRRSAHDALQVLIEESWRGRRWVVEPDIANCFSAIPHQELMQAVQETRLRSGCAQAAARDAARRGDGTRPGPSGSNRQPTRRGDYAPNAMDNFCFEVTLGYRRLERPRLRPGKAQS
jgi:RNA-directed DNA polymerase